MPNQTLLQLALLVFCVSVAGYAANTTTASAPGASASSGVSVEHDLPHPLFEEAEVLSAGGWTIKLLPANLIPLQASRDGEVVLLRDPIDNSYYRWIAGFLENLGQSSDDRVSMNNAGITAATNYRSTALYYHSFVKTWRRDDKTFNYLYNPVLFSKYTPPLNNGETPASIRYSRSVSLLQVDDEERLWVVADEEAGGPSMIATVNRSGALRKVYATNYAGVSRTGHSLASVPDESGHRKYYLDERQVDFEATFVNDNGIATAYALTDTWHSAPFIVYPDGRQEPVPKDPSSPSGSPLVVNPWIDSQGRLNGANNRGYAPVLVEKKLGADGQPVVPAEYLLVPYEPLPFPITSPWKTNHLVAPATYALQLGIAVDAGTGISRPFIATRTATLAVDANRDGIITLGSENASDKVSRDNPFRFWVNDDDDFDAIEGDDVPSPSSSDDGSATFNFDGDGSVDGVRDLVDFFPVYLDIKALLLVLPPSASIKYKLKHETGALNFVYTGLACADGTRYQTKDFGSVFGPSLDRPVTSAATRRISASGVELTTQFLTGIKDRELGVIMVEAWLPTTRPLVLSVEKADGTVITEVKLHLSITAVESMYRWVNLREVAGQGITRATNASEPANYPDSNTNGKMFVFLHGYNVNERDSRGWGAETFKRMYWSGSHAMFTMVSWHGDHSQIPIIGVSPDYWENINYAFMTAKALPAAVNSLPGSAKVIVGHSMGNVVVSSAINDHGLNVSHYFMLNAAVALEAYDPAAMSVAAMRNPAWASYETRLWPTEWFSFFPSGDGRHGLTWRDRFGNIANATNFYSSGEDVLNNNDVTPGELPSVGGERAWVLQEMAKGTNHIGAVLTFDIQGGWGFNSSWALPTFVPDDSDAGGYYDYRRPTPAQAAALTDAQLRLQPFFLPFQDARFLSSTAGSSAAAEYIARADALGGAIPALSFPTGRNPVPLFEDDLRNVDLMTLQDGWPRTGGRWFHSDAKKVAYRYNHKLWDTWTIIGELK